MTAISRVLPTGGHPGLVPDVAHAPRIWNYWLGGRDNFTIDRASGDLIARMYPDIVALAEAHQAFLRRAIQYLVSEAGIRLFLVIGIGLPIDANVHEVARALAPETRVVYVDDHPLVLAYARALLVSGQQGAVECVDADLHDASNIRHSAAQCGPDLGLQ